MNIDYTELMLIQARVIAQQLVRASGNEAFSDERFIVSLHTAFCIIRNDSYSMVLKDLLNSSALSTQNADVKMVVGLVVKQFAQDSKIPL